MYESAQIISIDSSNYFDYLEILEELCNSAENDDRKAAKNLSWKNWENNSSSLMYAIVKQRRFDSHIGQFDIVLYQGKPIAASGCYISDWSDKIMMIGVRTWTDPLSKNMWWHGNMLMPKQLDLALKKGCVAAVMSFNHYNIRLRNALRRASKQQAVLLGITHPDFYNDLQFLDGYYNIKDTAQSIAVKLISCSLDEFQRNYLPPEYK